MSQQARAKADGKPPGPVTFRDRKFTLPEKLPMELYLLDLPDEKDKFADLKAARLTLDAVASLLGPEQWQEFREMRPSIDEASSLYNTIMSKYTGLKDEESAPFDGSSPDTGTTRKQRSQRPTADLTSANSASEATQ
jgi:hypothetical protein